MKRSMGLVALLLAVALTGCTYQTTCYGTEPDGEVEKLRPCPQGWTDGDSRHIKEDEFKSLEVVDLNREKNKARKGF